MAPPLVDRPGRHRLDVPGGQAVAARVQLSFDDGGVGHDHPAILEDEVGAPLRMVPVLVGEPVRAGTPGGGEEFAKCCHLLRTKFAARESSHGRHTGDDTPLRPAAQLPDVGRIA